MLQSLPPLEFPELAAFWMKVFDQPASVFEGPWNALPPESRATLWQKEDGELVATVQLFVLPMRDEEGNEEKVGGIANVATLPSHRRQGRSEQLLREAISWMEDQGLAWSYLFTGVPDHYAKLGWEPLNDVWGTAHCPPGIAPLPPVSVEQDHLASAYSHAAQETPLSMVRTPAIWQSLVLPRLKDRLFWHIGGSYLVGQESDEGVEFIEWGGTTEAASLLLLRAMAHLGAETASCRLHRMEDLAPILASMGSSLSTESRPGWSMGRPLSRTPDFKSLSQGWFSLLDHF